MTSQPSPPTAPAVSMRLKGTLGLIVMLAALFGVAGTAFAGSGFLSNNSGYPNSLNGQLEGTFYAEPESIPFTCSESELSATLSEPSATLATSPTWSGCEAWFSSATVKAEGCALELVPGLEGDEVSIGPAECGPMQMNTSSTCSYKIPPQSGIDATIENSGNGVVVEVYDSNVTFERASGCSKGTVHGLLASTWKITPEDEGDSFFRWDSFELPPTARTDFADGVSDNEASLHATVNANVLPTEYQFEYGETTSYGSKAPASLAPTYSVYQDKEVNQTLESLNENTVYHYRVMATNSEGTTYGRDRTFETVGSEDTPVEIGWQSGTTELTATGTSAEQVLYSATLANNLVECEEASGAASNLYGTGASTIPLDGLEYHDSELTTCRGILGLERELEMNGCPLELHVGKSLGTAEAEGSVSIGKCAGEEEAIVFDGGPLCTISIPALQDLGPVHYTAFGGAIIVELSMTEIEFERSGFCGNGTVSDGEYTGTMNLIAKGGLTLE